MTGTDSHGHHPEEESYASVRYQCSPYGANTAFLPIIDQLRSAAGFTKNDSDDDCLDKLE